MESIDRLREYVTSAPPTSIGSMARAILSRAADTIEQEAMEERTAAYNEGYDAGFASADDWAAQHEDAMAERGWVRLPVDADGVPIHVGDVLDPPADCDDYPSLLVMRLTYDGYEDEWFFDGEVGGFCGMAAQRMDVAGWTHHHAPTVEDVLREFTDEVWNRCCEGATASDSGIDGLVAEYAAKLRLAGDE